MKQVNPTQTALRRYQVAGAILLAAYFVVLSSCVTLLKELHPVGGLRYLLCLAPVVPVALLVPAVVRYFRDTDEFERRLTTDSLAIAAAVTAILSVTYAFLELAGLPHLSAWITWTVLMFTWAIARCIVARRYQ